MGQNNATTSLFNLNNSQAATPQQGQGLFGSLGGINQIQSASNPFATSSANRTSSNMFGTMQNSQAGSQMPSNSIFSNSIGQQHQQSSIPGVRISVNELRPTTRFNDLHDDLQRVIEYVDAFILNMIHWQQQCEAANANLDSMCQALGPDAEHCSKSLDVVQQSLENDAESIAVAKKSVSNNAANAQLSFKVINNLRLPQQFHHSNLWENVAVPRHIESTDFDGNTSHGSSRNLHEYFAGNADSLTQSLGSYQRSIAEVESYLKGIEVTLAQQLQQMSFDRQSNLTGRSPEDQLRQLAAVLREFESGILGVATQVGGVREATQRAMLEPLDGESRSRLMSTW